METYLPAHLGFLNDAAHLLRVSAPETSAHLMDHRSELMSDNGLELTDSQRQRTCAACGHIMIPGAGSELLLEAPERSRQKKRRRSAQGRVAATAPTTALQKKMECGFCHETTVIKLPPAPKIAGGQRRKVRGGLSSRVEAKSSLQAPAQKHTTAAAVATAAVTASSSSSPSTLAPKTAANASSKKRAKNRKAGLQALLSQSSQGSRSLSLADFARK